MDAPNDKAPERVVETYAEDMAKVIEGDNTGLIRKIIHEGERQSIERKNLSPESKKNRIFTIAGVILVIGACALLVLFGSRANKNTTVNVAPQYKPPIFIEQNYFGEIGGLTKEQIIQSVLNEVSNTDLKDGGIEGIYLTENKKVIDFSRLLALLEANLPNNFNGYVSGNILVGVFNHGIDEAAPPIAPSTPPEVSPEESAPAPTITVEGTPVNFSSGAFFKTGTVDFVDADAKDKAKKALSDFLDGVDFSTSKIQVTGTYSIERPSDKNDQLAEARRKLGVDILNEVLNEKYGADDVAKITVESSAKGMSVKDTHTEEEIQAMTPDELKSAIDMTQGIQYKAEAKTKPQVIQTPAPESATITPSAPEVAPSASAARKPKDLFILFEVKSFNDIFPYLQSWEGKMFSDLGGLFDPGLSPDTKYLLTKNFEDGFVANKNARILKDSAGNPVLMYVFIDDQYVLMTNDPGTAREVVARLSGSEVRK